MDSKGLLNIEYVFCIIIGILILITLMPLLDDNLNANIELNEEASARSEFKQLWIYKKN